MDFITVDLLLGRADCEEGWLMGNRKQISGFKIATEEINGYFSTPIYLIVHFRE